MDEELEKIDVIRERTGCGYADAKSALEEAGGDLVGALVIIEKRQAEKGEDILTVGAQLVKEIEELTKGGEVNKIRIKIGDKVVKELPTTLSPLGTILFSFLAILLNKSSIELEKVEEEKKKE